MGEQIEYGVEPIKALRLFSVKNGYLHSITGEKWVPGEVKASHCQHMYGHPGLHVPPAKECTCGIWTCKSRKALWKTGYGIPYVGGRLSFRSRHTGLISAQVEIWGIVVEHEDGYRSEYARIIPETINWWPRRQKGYQMKYLKFIKDRYTYYSLGEEESCSM